MLHSLHVHSKFPLRLTGLCSLQRAMVRHAIGKCMEPAMPLRIKPSMFSVKKDQQYVYFFCDPPHLLFETVWQGGTCG